MSIATEAAALCTSFGHTVEPDTLPIDPDELKGAHGTLALANVAANLDARARFIGRAITPDDIELVTWNNYQAAKSIAAPAYAEAMNSIRRFGLIAARFFEHYDLLLTPTMACLPPRIGALDMMAGESASYLELLFRMIGFTALFNDTGNPAISLPLGRSAAGLPVGVQFVAPYGRERRLLRFAAQLESAGAFTPALVPD